MFEGLFLPVLTPLISGENECIHISTMQSYLRLLSLHWHFLVPISEGRRGNAEGILNIEILSCSEQTGEVYGNWASY